MRNAIVTLSGAGLLVSLILSSCIVKEKSTDGEVGGTEAGGTSTIFGAGGSSATPKGGSANGGSSTSTGATSVAEACPDLLSTLNPGAPGVCSTSEAAASFSQINMLIVLDKSGSMTSTPTGYSKSKWAGAVDSLKAALKPTEPLVKYGFMLYPYADTGATSCELGIGAAAVNVGVGPAADTVPQINSLLADTQPGGGTPTAAALTAALDYYTSSAGVNLVGAKYVLLVTDGGPNCNSDITCGPDTCTANMDKSGSCGTGVPNCCDVINNVPGRTYPPSLCLDDASVLTKIQELRAHDIKTFVVGIPGTEQYSTYLDTFADAGGVPVTDPAKTRKYYEVTGESGLVDTFNAITTSLVRSCTVPLAAAPLDRDNINIAIDCTPIPRGTADAPNWHYDETGPAIVVEGAQCARIEKTGVKRVDVVLGCPPIVQL